MKTSHTIACLFLLSLVWTLTARAQSDAKHRQQVVRIADGQPFLTVSAALATTDRNDGIQDVFEIRASRLQEDASIMLSGADPLIIRGQAGGGGRPVVIPAHDQPLFVFDPPSRQATHWTIENLVLIPDVTRPKQTAPVMNYLLKRDMKSVSIDLNNVVVTAAAEDGTPVAADGPLPNGARCWPQGLTAYGLVGGKNNVMRVKDAEFAHISGAAFQLHNFGAGNFCFEFAGGRITGCGGGFSSTLSRNFTIRLDHVDWSQIAGDALHFHNNRQPVRLEIGAGSRFSNILGRVVHTSRFRGQGAGLELDVSGTEENPIMLTDIRGGIDIAVDLVEPMHVQNTVFTGSNGPAIRFATSATGRFTVKNTIFKNNLTGIGLLSPDVSGIVDACHFAESAITDLLVADGLDKNVVLLENCTSDTGSRILGAYEKAFALHPPRQSANPYEQCAVRRAHHSVAVTLQQVQFWQQFKQDAYAERAAWEIREMLRCFQDGKWNDASQFVPYPFMYAVRALAAEGYLDDQDLAVAQRVMETRYGQRGLGGYSADDNQNPPIAAGLAIAAKLFPDSLRAEHFQWFANAVWDAWYEPNRDTSENSASYNVIFLENIIHLAQELNCEEKLKNRQVRDMFERFRDMLSPRGRFPNVGESWRPSADPNVVVEDGSQAYIAVFEKAAALYGDGTFRAAAARIFERVGQAGYWAIQWRAPEIKSVFAKPRSQVTLRRVPAPLAAAGRDPFSTFDKLILCPPSPEERSPFVMVELYNCGGKTSPQQVQPIIHYEFDGQVLLTGSGRDFSATAANMLLLARSFDDFPNESSMHVQPRPEQWYTARIYPEQAFPVGGGAAAGSVENFCRRYIDRLQFFGDGPLTIANLRLEGTAGTRTLPSDEWLAPATWPAQAKATVTEDANGSNTALRLDLSGGRRGISRAIAEPVAFDLREHQYITFDWKIEQPDKLPPQFQFVGHKPFSITALTNAAHPMQAGAVDLPNGSAYGWTATGKNYFTPGSSARRDVLLDPESGVLIVLDELHPGADAMGLAAGPIWQLPGTKDPRLENNWLATTEGDMRLLIWNAPAPGREVGCVTVPRWACPGQKVAFAKQTIRNTDRLRFVTVLIPLKAGDDPQPVAESISVIHDDTTMQINITMPDGNTQQIKMSPSTESPLGHNQTKRKSKSLRP